MGGRERAKHIQANVTISYLRLELISFQRKMIHPAFTWDHMLYDNKFFASIKQYM